MPVQPAGRVLEHPQLSTRDRWRTVQTAAGPIRAILPLIIEGYEQPMGLVPGLGNTDAVLAGLGLSGNGSGGCVSGRGGMSGRSSHA